MPAVCTRGIQGKPTRLTYTAGSAGVERGLVLVQGASDTVLNPAAAVNASPVGILEEPSVNIGDPISVVVLGEAVAIAGAAINAGGYVTSNATGQLIPSTASGDHVVGLALSSAALAGDEFLMLINPFIRSFTGAARIPSGTAPERASKTWAVLQHPMQADHST